MTAATPSHTDITIRMLDPSDEGAIRRLAQLDSSPVPAGQMLGASLDGRLVVAVAVASGETVADPFVPTADLRALLEGRAKQLRAHAHPKGTRLGRLVRPRRRSRAALPASPPGGGGRLLTLDC